MTEQEFDTRLQQIEAEYARHREGADAKRDQEVSRLFVECGWTQERIAGRMGQKQPWVSKRLLFGRFLRIIPARNNSFSPPKPLTEWRFRENFRASGKRKKETEDERFARVLELLKADTSDMPRGYGNLQKKPDIKKAVAEILAAGRRLTHQQIAERVNETKPGTDGKQISSALQELRKNPPRGMALEGLHNGRSHRYRLVQRKGPLATPVSADAAGALAADALPLIKECIEIMRKPIVGRQQTLALDNLGRIERMLSHLLVPEAVV